MSILGVFLSFIFLISSTYFVLIQEGHFDWPILSRGLYFTVLKAIPVASLIISVFIFAKPVRSSSSFLSYKTYTLLALSFSLIGDIVLSHEDEHNAFHLGLWSFFIAHIFYATSMYTTITKNVTMKLLTICAIGALCSFFQYYSYMSSDLYFPCACYITLLGLKTWRAAESMFALSFTPETSPYQHVTGYLLCFGALIFDVSDSTLSANKFYYNGGGNNIGKFGLSTIVMITYWMSQAMLSLGCILLSEKMVDGNKDKLKKAKRG